MINRSIQKFTSNNASITRSAWLIFSATMVIMISFLYLIEKTKKIDTQQFQLLEKHNEFGFQLHQTTNTIYLVLSTEEDTSPQLRQEIKKDMGTLNQKLNELQTISTSIITDVPNDSLNSIFYQLNSYNDNLQGITKLIVKMDKGFLDNQNIFKTQLNNNLKAYQNALSNLKNSSSNYFKNKKEVVLWMNYLLIAIFICITPITYLKVLNPLRKRFAINEEIFRNNEGMVENLTTKTNAALNLQKDSEGKLKIKQAQVVKLQQSLEESITQIENLTKDKSTIYLQIAMKLDGFLKVMNLQKEILENQNSIAQNASWRPLSSTISQLNSLVGDYFTKSKHLLDNEAQSNVYLSQLISEVILSFSNGKSKFKQVSDMPSITTNVEILKSALEPYFELISEMNSDGYINVSAFESGSVCEIKFMGLSNEFNTLLLNIERKDTVDLSFSEFKLRMAKNAIIERGGKTWSQDDIANKSIFCIRWVL